ncbi:FMN-binding negative transcriptional regulator [Pseudomonas sp. JDS28PS106]|uniref:FMN-binding negative transcriptional regulator n=1 Tax=Pseudomonas sp. JDS28PS106 TaxID=2497235 RepID=UPI002FD00BD9
MYVPKAFAETDIPALHALMDQTRLAVLVTHGEQGLQASHLPLLRTSDGKFGTLYGHMAKANPQWRDLAAGAEALVIFPGADAYVTPSFYPGKAEHHKVVPTWNYQAVHAYGQAEVFTDAEPLRQLVSDLTRKHEAARPAPWSVDDAPQDYIASMLRAIVGFALPIQRLEGKRKLSQNRTAEDQAGVRAGLAASSDLQDREVARLMTQEIAS